MATTEPFAEGVRRFRTRIYPSRRELFRRLAESQNPRALFLTCADSRVIPSLITNTGPGELFVERNPGNIVPVYDEVAVGVSASIEYALTALRARHVIICGHSDCGAVHGMLHPTSLAHMPAVARWLDFAAEALLRLDREPDLADEAARTARLTQLNVIAQMDNLMTHPCVRAALSADAVEIHGWVYDIEAGRVDAYNSETGAFAEIT